MQALFVEDNQALADRVGKVPDQSRFVTDGMLDGAHFVLSIEACDTAEFYPSFPHMDGWAVLKHLRKRVPNLLSTALGGGKNRGHGLAPGVGGYPANATMRERADLPGRHLAAA